MNRRRPIPRSNYSWLPRAKPEFSQHYDTILGGAVRRYRADGREVCQDNAAGYREYKRRVEAMVKRQENLCCLCHKRLRAADATFEHQRRRGMGAAFRQDAIVDREGNPINGAAHWICNSEKG